MTAARVPVLSSERPFPGLRPFEFEDHDYFCGRESSTYALYLLVGRSRFAAVVGSSGSGKSSLVRAGLLPLLKEESDNPGGRVWRRLTMRPHDAPIAQLAKALTGLARDHSEVAASALQDRIAFHLQSSSGISEALSEIGNLDKTSILLLVDQFEELFRYSSSHADEQDFRKQAQSRDEANRFVQLLLDASRNPTFKVHVLLTMRSDFIGDCARFHGLPEAVSAAQFLVPSLPREQREEVIRTPLERAGASIEPELVERLLNDSSDELDQLPVLQHCLLRLWEKAGTASEGPSSTDASAEMREPREQPAAARHLTVAHYRAIGGMTNALSQHADELLSKLQGRERAVEQTFRALSEVDREGRAIRRGLRFERLRAETGVAEADLREVLDRFRADDCSFLTPSLSAEENLAADTLIDVGHESLLRRWEKVSGKPGALDPKSKGWLRAEEADGQRYRRLLDSKNLHRKQFLEDWPWWTKPPRTRDWANRYGGKYEQVDSLLRESQRTDKHRIVALCFAAAAVITLMVVGTYFGYDYVKKRNEAAFADEYYNRAKGAAVTLMAEVQKSLNAGSMRPSTAQALLQTAEEILAGLTRRKETPDITAQRAEASLMISDAYSDSGDKPRASEYIEKARELAKDLTREHPDDIGFQHLLFRTLFRIADAAAMRRDPRAQQDYGDALAVIEKLIARQPANDEWRKDSAFIYGKLGDLSQGKKDFEGALKDYTTSVEIMEKVVASDRKDNFLWKRDLASARERVGQAYAGLEDHNQALENYRSALLLRLDLIRRQPDNGIVQTHVAVSHREVGDTLKRLGRIDDATMEFRKELAMREVIADSDPGNASKQVTLALTLERVGAELHARQRVPETIDLYRQALAVWTKLVKRDQNNPRWRQGLQVIEKKIADLTAEPR